MQGSNNTIADKTNQDLGFEKVSQEIKDSLIHLQATGLYPFSISKIAAIEPENNRIIEWIMQKGTSKDFEALLYHHSAAEMKAIGIKGLIRRKDTSLFKHLTYAIPLDLNVHYGLTCQHLGGYFLYQLNYRSSDSLSNYFSAAEMEKLAVLVESRNFGCTLEWIGCSLAWTSQPSANIIKNIFNTVNKVLSLASLQRQDNQRFKRQ